jgi:predicted transcriptional regulator
MKKRRNFTLSDEALKKLSELAKKEGRSNSSMVEQLIVRESKKCLN